MVVVVAVVAFVVGCGALGAEGRSERMQDPEPWGRDGLGGAVATYGRQRVGRGWRWWWVATLVRAWWSWWW